jgi:hypothetical protein
VYGPRRTSKLTTSRCHGLGLAGGMTPFGNSHPPPRQHVRSSSAGRAPPLLNDLYPQATESTARGRNYASGGSAEADSATVVADGAQVMHCTEVMCSVVWFVWLCALWVDWPASYPLVHPTRTRTRTHSQHPAPISTCKHGLRSLAQAAGGSESDKGTFVLCGFPTLLHYPGSI